MITLCKSGLLTNHVFTIVSKSESLDKNLMTCISSSYFGFDLLKLKYEEEHDQKKNEEEKNSSNDFIGERMNFLLNGIWVHEMNSVTFV